MNQPTHPVPCPSCGYCPTCGRPGYGAQPYRWIPYWTTTTSGTTVWTKPPDQPVQLSFSWTAES